jgi:HK97 family phage major capsid protein
VKHAITQGDNTEMNPTVLKNLWEQRQRVITQLQGQAFVRENREPTAEERSADEKWIAELDALNAKIEKGLDEAEREQRSAESFKRYEKLMGKGEGSNPATPDILLPNMSMVDWAQRHGMSEGYEERSFDSYLRGLIHSERYEQRFMGEGTGPAGGHLVPTPLAASVIDLARNATRVIQAGAVTVP